MASNFIPGAWLPVRGLQAREPSTALGDALDAIAANRLARDRMAQDAELERARQGLERGNAMARIIADLEAKQIGEDATDVRKYREVLGEEAKNPDPAGMNRVEAFAGLPGVRRAGITFGRETEDEAYGGPRKTAAELVGRERPEIPPEASLVPRPGPVNTDDPASIEKGIVEPQAYEAQGGDKILADKVALMAGPGGLPIMVSLEKLKAEQEAKKYDQDAKAALAAQDAERSGLEGRRRWYSKDAEGTQFYHPLPIVDNRERLQQYATDKANKRGPVVRGETVGETGLDARNKVLPLLSLLPPEDAAKAQLAFGDKAEALDQSARNSRASSSAAVARLTNTDENMKRLGAKDAQAQVRWILQQARTGMKNPAALETESNADKVISLLDTLGENPLANNLAVRQLIFDMSGKATTSSEMQSYMNPGGILDKAKQWLGSAESGTLTKENAKNLRSVMLVIKQNIAKKRRKIAESAYHEAKRNKITPGVSENALTIYHDLMGDEGDPGVPVGDYDGMGDGSSNTVELGSRSSVKGDYSEYDE
jgi:hypothetical protein